MPPNSGDSAEERELEPIDPKAASRAIKRHIQHRRATEIRKKEAEPAPAPPPGQPPASKDGAPPAGKGTQASPGAPTQGQVEALHAVPIRNRDLVQLMEHSPGSLMDEWLQAQLGDDPRTAVQVSRTEMEFLLLKRTLLE